MAAADTQLEAQATAMAEKALAALPEAARAAKIAKVKEGILRRLQAQAAQQQQQSPAAAAGAAVAPAATAGAVPGGAPAPAPCASGAAPAAAAGAAAAPPPPPPPEEEFYRPARLEGIESCGDELWFADAEVRRRLHDSVAEAHKEQKILVAAPTEEVKRICPGEGRVLAAGAVLRLGGSHLGGFGDSDIAYAYRQLSRALHPDKNPDCPDAPHAFKRLSEAADELRQGLQAARDGLQALCAAMGGTATPEMLERPQEALFAEATRILYAVLGVIGEGEVSSQALSRGAACFAASGRFHKCRAQALLADWFEQPALLELFAGAQVRAAYDCAPKRLRAQFLCALHRAMLAEAGRQSDCIRGNWQAVQMQFPELQLWVDLRDRLKGRAWAAATEKDGAKGSRWDDDEPPKPSDWAKTWRDRVQAVLPRGSDGAAPWADREVRLLSAALWNDVAAWAATDEVGCERHLQLFRAEPSHRLPGGEPAPAEEGPVPAGWAFAPAADLLLIVGEGLVGVTAEGVLVDSRRGHERIPFADALSGNYTLPPKSRSRSPEPEAGLAAELEETKKSAKVFRRNASGADLDEGSRALFQSGRKRRSGSSLTRERRRRRGSRSRSRRRDRRKDKDKGQGREKGKHKDKEKGKEKANGKDGEKGMDTAKEKGDDKKKEGKAGS